MGGGVGFKVAQEALKLFVVPEQSGRGEEEVIEFLVGQRRALQQSEKSQDTPANCRRGLWQCRPTSTQVP